ncbi:MULTISPECIES: hypothetical protein [Rhizobium]|uniref:Uncharacterized protein n=1 Tax=Rhizobium changzhiense TaxID=2692317 RepID=A0A7Z0RKC0_9HYPH|nr:MULTISPECIES: hypothetical protein [Rhizobium]MBA5804058.1 hypothetical protein [Rhizobium changzhiense]MCH4546254.1 hypothetical protein [Rhizobium changzhiense]MCV9942408.1 hypothetical protein [Rhizobium sp. BT-175]MCW0015631.1 hypothetical protein [Rhizobium sp. BT-226]NZD62317.1 hypothetical protein [Rhizobium changzhiense]
MKPLVGRPPGQRREKSRPAKNVDLVVTRLPAAEVGPPSMQFCDYSIKKWKISHKFSFQIAGFPYKIIEMICHVARNRLVQKLYLSANAES